MSTPTTASRFQTTSWTLIRRVGASPDDLAQLLSTYWRPVYSFLRRQGHDCHAARDLTQQFMVKIIEQDLITRADPSRGRFRSFLLTTLERFVIDQFRKSGRGGKRVRVNIPADPSELAAAEPGAAEDPSSAFDRQWATMMIEITLSRLEASCCAAGQDRHWQAFERQDLAHARGCEVPAAEKLAQEIGARDRVEVYSMVNTVRRKFRRIFRDVVAETVEDPTALENELADLRRFIDSLVT